jgi:hypothetical protein
MEITHLLETNEVLNNNNNNNVISHVICKVTPPSIQMWEPPTLNKALANHRVGTIRC